MRCWIAACLTFLAAELWSSEQNFIIRSVMQDGAAPVDQEAFKPKTVLRFRSRASWTD